MESESIKIVLRFFKAIDEIIAKKELRGIQTFTNRYLIDKRNFYKVRNNPESNIFQVAWLYYLVNDFNVSANWLLTGKGNIFTKKQILCQNVQNVIQKTSTYQNRVSV